MERFTRIGPDQIDYQFTFTDPTTWTKPWSLAIPVRKKDTGAPTYTWAYFEWACHEGNYSLANILRGARAEEKLPTIEVQGADLSLTWARSVLVDAGVPVRLAADATAPVTAFVGLRALERPIVRSEDDAKATNPANLNSHSPNLQLDKYPRSRRADSGSG